MALRSIRSGCQPVFDLEIWDTAEVAHVGGNDGEPSGECNRGDTKVGLVQPSALGLQASPEWPIDFGGALIEGEDQQSADDEVADLLGQGGATPSCRSIQEFSQRDGGGELLLRGCPGQPADEGEGRIPPDDRAQHVGVEAVHGQPMSGAALSRARRRAA